MTHDPHRTPDRLATAQQIIAERFSSMMSLADQREQRFRTEMESAPATGQCPNCGAAGQPMDEPETLELSVRHNLLKPIYLACDHCMAEAKVQERMASYGVPRRVRHATLENFTITDPRQETALDAVRIWLLERTSLFLLLLGTCGAGKGHLAAAAVRRFRASATWITHAGMIDGLYGIPLDYRPGYIGRLQRIPLLVIDEMGGKAMTSDTPETFYKILDRRYEEGLKTILIGNIPLRSKDETKPCLISLTGGERMESRLLQTGTSVSCRWADYRNPSKD